MIYIIILLIILILLNYSDSLSLDVSPRTIRCVGQELDQEDAAIFSVKASSHGKELKGDMNTLLATISDPEGTTLWSEELKVNNKKEYKTTVIEVRGVYELCFEVTGHSSIRVTFNVDFKNKATRQYADPSKKVAAEELPQLEVQLKLAEDALNQISNEIDFARRQESLLREAGERTSTRIQWFSILSIAVLLVTSIWQIVYLRRFFTSKKLL